MVPRRDARHLFHAALAGAVLVGLLGATGLPVAAQQPGALAHVGSGGVVLPAGLAPVLARLQHHPATVATSLVFTHTTLLAADGQQGDHFGYAVAVSGNTAVIGAAYRNDFSGVAYVFVRDGTTWIQQAELTASDAASIDQFGSAVAVCGNTAVIGARTKNNGTGAAYVFVRSGSIWTQQAELTPPAGVPAAFFGNAVAVSGATAVVGEPGDSDVAGSAYVFVQQGTTWTQQAALTPSTNAPTDAFGTSVATDGTLIVVGAPMGFDPPLAGAAYVFVCSGGTWTQRATLTAADAASNDQFGSSVAVSGHTVMIGAPHKNNSTGAVYAFVLRGSTWTQQAELSAADAATGDGFGQSVAVSGAIAVVGAPGKSNSAGVIAAGAAYVFVCRGGSWAQKAELADPGGARDDQFGNSVAVNGLTTVVGAIGMGNATGVAFVYWPSRELDGVDPGSL